MRVQILKLGAGPGGVRTPGMVCEVSDGEGAALVADKAARVVATSLQVAAADAEVQFNRFADAAEAVTPASEAAHKRLAEEIETATAPPAPERAVVRRRKKGPRVK